MQLTSSAFVHNTQLPTDYTCKGRAVSPPLTISDAPTGTQSFALIMHDPDAVGGHDFLHWSVWNIPAGTTTIAQATLPHGSLQGTNDYPTVAYGPACPPAGTGMHHYIFDLYALDISLALPEGADRKALETAIKDHTLATAHLIGIVKS